MRIAIGGIGHETNSFCPGVTPLEKFLDGGEMPPALEGAALVPTLATLNFGASGFIRAMPTAHFVPLAWGQGGAGAPVADAAFEWFATRMTARLRDAGPVDAVYLDLHGAMMTESLADAEGELLRRIRPIVGPDVPIVASMDYHGNLTVAMLEQLDALSSYRTYPHVDRHDAGARVAGMLEEIMRRGRPTAKRIARGPFLIPLPFENTDRDPSRSLVRHVESVPPGVLSFEYVPGFAASDFPEAGPSVFAIGYDQDSVDAAVAALHGHLVAAEDAFAEPILDADQALAEAAAIRLQGARGPVILADTQDNPGGGGTGNTTGLLRAMLAAGVRKAALAILYDPRAARVAHAAGMGAEIEITLGGQDGPVGRAPLHGRFTVMALSDGGFTATGRTVGGRRIALGPTAVLRIAGIDVIVASIAMQPYDIMVFRHLGLEPAGYDLLALKSTVHFRADFAPLAAAVLLVKSPGRHLVDLQDHPFTALRPGIRLGPGGPAFVAGRDRSPL
ncbi:MAG: M81 family metallopeptidase [Gluconacetobacter sp.]|uniref:Microcystinase C n=1 Tax=Gluconacetobacter dulcium TaxID=2729096 RepID=A0A7W4PGF7_9PROT|nr:M81 family metallopeptidase [Gluconacetobacter dulcium]MBB2197107.1 M81 family metallopeptidase [Gluconacetobacter dulcium]